MLFLRRGRYVARTAKGDRDISRAFQLRDLAFFGGDGQQADKDSFDEVCTHLLVEDCESGELVCCFRFLLLNDGGEIERCYSAQYYELSALRAFQGPMVEMGRFCVHPDRTDPDILRIAWAAMTRYVDDNEVEFLFGCSSFAGTDAADYLDAFAVLRDRHIAPRKWLPKIKAPKVFQYAARLTRKPNLKLAQMRMPPLLRTYLLMGGWVSDHAVVDPHMNTMHVFTGLEIKEIPPARKRLLRGI